MQEVNEWYSYDHGATIKSIGSEGGIIVLDEEHASGARITIEKDGIIAPFAITIGIYGLMFHTAFVGDTSEAEAIVEFEKAKIEEMLSLIDMQDEASKRRIEDLMQEIASK